MSAVTILSPVPPAVVTEHPLAARSHTLDGRRVGLLDNRKANAGRLLDTIGCELAARRPGTELVTEYKAATTAAPAAVVERLRVCDAVILAIAD